MFIDMGADWGHWLTVAAAAAAIITAALAALCAAAGLCAGADSAEDRKRRHLPRIPV